MGGSGGGGGPPPQPQATPISGVPIAGSGGGTNFDPYDYGKYQSFLPDLPSGGPAPLATGITDDMLRYRSPSEIMNPGTAGGPPSQALAPPPPSGGGGGLPGKTDLPSFFPAESRDRLAELLAARGMLPPKPPPPATGPAPPPTQAPANTPETFSMLT